VDIKSPSRYGCEEVCRVGEDVGFRLASTQLNLSLTAIVTSLCITPSAQHQPIATRKSHCRRSWLGIWASTLDSDITFASWLKILLNRITNF
jgi:hypothetical protein